MVEHTGRADLIPWWQGSKERAGGSTGSLCFALIKYPNKSNLDETVLTLVHSLERAQCSWGKFGGRSTRPACHIRSDPKAEREESVESGCETSEPSDAHSPARPLSLKVL